MDEDFSSKFLNLSNFTKYIWTQYQGGSAGSDNEIFAAQSSRCSLTAETQQSERNGGSLTSML